MELEFETRTTAYLRRSVHGVCRQEQTQEVIVPDASPDASRVVYCCAQAIVRSKDCLNGAVQISGTVQASTIYCTNSDENARVLTAQLPFTLRLEAAEAREDTQVTFDCRVLCADAMLVNSRKVLFRVQVGAEIFGYAKDAMELPLLKQTPKELQLRCSTYPLPLAAETAERSFQVSEELELPAGRPEVEDVIAASVIPEITEQRLLGSKAVFKGTMQLKVLYQAPDGSVNCFSQNLPFSQYCQLEADYDDEGMRMWMGITGCEVQLERGERPRLLLRADLLAQCLVTRTVELTVCEDAFGAGALLKPEWTELSFEGCLDRQMQRMSVRESVDGTALRGVIDSEIFVDFPRVEPGGTGARITVPVAVRALGLDLDGALCGVAGTVAATSELAMDRGARCEASAVQCPDGYASPGTQGVEVRYELALDLSACREQTLRTLSGGTLEPPAQDGRRPSVILRTITERCAAWDIARQYGTRVEALCTANALSDGDVEAGTLLLIPME